MKRKAFLLSLILLPTIISVFAQSQSDKILGVWINEKKSFKIEFYRDGNSYSAKIIWLAEPNEPDGAPKLDRNNPDIKKRKSKLIGLTIISGLRFTNNQWSNGRIYLPKRGEYANCTIIMKNSDKIQILVSKGWISETKIWIRE